MADYVIERCRTCLIKPSDMVSLVADHVVCDKVMSVLDLLKTCTSVQIELDDGYPQFVCLDCIRSAEKSYEFRTQCEKADSSLRSQIITNFIDFEVLEGRDDLELIDDKYTSEENCSEILENVEDRVIKCEEVEDIVETVEVQEAFSCTICHLIFPTPAALAKHSSTKHPPKFLQCPKCPTRCISQQLLDDHILKHSQKPSRVSTRIPAAKSGRIIPRKRTVDFICAICGKHYASLVNLRAHVRRHGKLRGGSAPALDAEQSVYVCQDCDHQFDTADDLQMHMEAIHNFKTESEHNLDADSSKDEPQQAASETPPRKKSTGFSAQDKLSYKCKLCPEELPSLMSIKEHLSTHNVTLQSIFQQLLYRCTECRKDFPTIYEYFRHSTMHQDSSTADPTTGTFETGKKRPYKCTDSDCSKAFPSPSALRNHLRSHESPWPKKCRYCPQLVSKWHDYTTHLNEAHEDQKTFICAQCGKKFFRERNLQSHVKTHSGERNYMCDFCGFSFHAQNNLVAHRRIHTGVKPYKCTFCPQAFSQHAGLRSHLLNHTGEKKYECSTCQKKFLRVGALKNHIKTHTGVKDYACHICGAKFGASSTRKKHLLTHTGERNHVCDFCGKAFSRRSNLNVHRKIHTGETPHVCEVCGKGFIQAHVLRTHMNTHRKHSKSIVQSEKGLSKLEMTAEVEIETEIEETEELTVLVELPE